MSNFDRLPGLRQAPKPRDGELRHHTEVMILTKDGVEAWLRPPFQRPVRMNAKMTQIADEIRRTQQIPGVVHIGILPDKKHYLIDGQHRIEAFRMSGVAESLADVRHVYCSTMAECAAEFRRLNGSITRMRPDDILRAYEDASPALQYIRRECPFVGYDNIRRNENQPVLSMSMVLRVWKISGFDVPTSTCGSAESVVESMDEGDAYQLCRFLDCCYTAWQRHPETIRLWGALNLVICAWLWRNTVMVATARGTRLTPELFTKGLMALTTMGMYIDWIVGRKLGDRDRSPCYVRVKQIFITRLQSDIGKRITLPSPPWAHEGGNATRLSSMRGVNF